MSRKEQAAASRTRLVDAARTCFAMRGYEATTVAAILERAGMARGALYHYFPDGKREIFGVVFECINSEFHAKRDAVSGIDSPLARINAAAATFVDLCTEEDFARIALIDAPQLIPGQAERGSSYRLLRDELEAAAACGEIRRLHVEATAISLYGAVRSAGEFVIAATDRHAAAATAAQSIGLLLDGLRADTSRRPPDSGKPPGDSGRSHSPDADLVASADWAD